MKFSQMLFVLIFCCAIISCKNGANEKRTNEPKKNPIPSTEYKKRGKSIPEIDPQKTIEKPADQESKKKKLKAMDTLKPITTTP